MMSGLCRIIFIITKQSIKKDIGPYSERAYNDVNALTYYILRILL